jgi:hypothetical protein
MTHQEPQTVEQPQFNDIYKLLMEIRRRRKARKARSNSENQNDIA